MPVGSEIKEMILEGASADELKKTAIRLGMKTLRMSGLTKVDGGGHLHRRGDEGYIWRLDFRYY